MAQGGPGQKAERVGMCAPSRNSVASVHRGDAVIAALFERARRTGWALWEYFSLPPSLRRDRELLALLSAGAGESGDCPRSFMLPLIISTPKLENIVSTGTYGDGRNAPKRVPEPTH